MAQLIPKSCRLDDSCLVTVFPHAYNQNDDKIMYSPTFCQLVVVAFDFDITSLPSLLLLAS